MKKIFNVKKRTLLLIAGIVWLMAGFNVARLGVLSYVVIEKRWYLYVLSAVVFVLFGRMFFKMSKNIQNGSLDMKSIVRFGIFLM